MAHGTPLATGARDDACGAAGPYLLEVGISSSYHIAKFFGLTQPSDATAENAATVAISPAMRSQIEGPAQMQLPEAAGDAFDEKLEATPEQAAIPRIDIGAVIAKALTAAGLMKGR
jgi:hypothetical protein